MGYSYPPRTQERILQGVKVVDGELYMQVDGEHRYVYGEPYLNTSNGEIVIR